MGNIQIREGFLCVSFQFNKKNSVEEGPFSELIRETSDVREYTVLLRKEEY